MIHPAAIVETQEIGEGTNVWAFAHIMPGAKIGKQCNIADRVFVEGNAVIGDGVTVKNNVCIWEGVTIDDGAFIGPSVTFTNDRFPRSPRMKSPPKRYAEKSTWLEKTHVGKGCSIGAGAVICPGIVLGAYCMIAAGAVVTRDVEPLALVSGNPGRPIGIVCICGMRLQEDAQKIACQHCGMTEAERSSLLSQHTQK